jgi:hypothetical protein
MDFKWYLVLTTIVAVVTVIPSFWLFALPAWAAVVAVGFVRYRRRALWLLTTLPLVAGWPIGYWFMLRECAHGCR